jgi:putative acetyltransferase
MITIRPETAEDYAAIREVTLLAFGQEKEAQLVEDLRGLLDFIPELSLVAVQGGQVVGHILFSPMAIETKKGAVPALSLAPVSVRPECQN